MPNDNGSIKVYPFIGFIKHPIEINKINFNKDEVNGVFSVTLKDLLAELNNGLIINPDQLTKLLTGKCLAFSELVTSEQKFLAAKILRKLRSGELEKVVPEEIEFFPLGLFSSPKA